MPIVQPPLGTVIADRVRLNTTSHTTMPDPTPTTGATVFTADLAGPATPLKHAWQWCVGSDHATTALRADWQQQLTQARRDLGFRHVRFHGILDDDMGTLICQSDEPVYSFFNTDRIFDFLLSIGMRPVVELSFMPRMLSSGNDIVFHYQGNVTPPKDMARWSELVRRLAAHWVERYGLDEVAQWPFECWNEPNLRAFWTADQNAYFALYRATAEALKSVSPRLQVGGPATAANAWLPEFLGFCESARPDPLPVDFVSTHYYPTDPFGAIDSDTITQLEHAPPGVMRTRASEAREAVRGHAQRAGREANPPPLYYTEWNISSNPRDTLHDDAFSAAFAARILMEVDDQVDGYSWWTFTDIFEENYFPSVPFHGGFGLMNLYGIPKPTYRAFQMLRALGDECVAVDGRHATLAAWVGRRRPDPAAVPVDDLTGPRVLLVNQAAPRHPIAPEPVALRLALPPGRGVRAVTWSRIDADHANPAGAWRAMGSPEYLSPAQVAALTAVSQVVPEPVPFRVEGGVLVVEGVAAATSVNLVEVTWEAAA